MTEAREDTFAVIVKQIMRIEEAWSSDLGLGQQDRAADRHAHIQCPAARLGPETAMAGAEGTRL